MIATFQPCGLRCIALFSMLLLCAPLCMAGVLRVDSTAEGSIEDGATWASAYVTLQEALAVAQGGDEVWVAAGTYRPGEAGERSPSFLIPDGVAVYGGFDGSEDARDARDARDPVGNLTTLSGDVDGDDSDLDGPGASNNSYHVVKVIGAASHATRIDGFTVSGGQAVSPFMGTYVNGGGVYVESARLIIAQCTFTSNMAHGFGGAVFVKDGTATVLDCTFTSNSSNGFGSAISAIPDDGQLREASLDIQRCTFRDNGPSYTLHATHANVALARNIFVDNEGGAVAANDHVTLEASNCLFTRNVGMQGTIRVGTLCEAAFTHCTFAHNYTTEIYVASVDYQHTFVSITNSILWNDSYPILDFDPATASVTVSNSVISGGFEGDGNIDADPQFREAQPPGQLNWNSTAIDMCADAGVPDDINGARRPQNLAYDAGAYEFGTDTDGGGLPDGYETQHGLDPADSEDDAVDSDADGLDNREEFRRGTNPADANDPPSRFYVAKSGSDESGDGSEQTPWATIGHAMANAAEGTDTFPITINLAPAQGDVYEEKVVFRPHVRLVGEDAATTTIRYYDAADDEHIVITAAEDTAISNCTLTVPEGIAAVTVLLKINDVEMDVNGVVFNGNDSQYSTAILISGTASSDSSIHDSVVKRVNDGIWATNTHVNLTRNSFEDILRHAVFVRLPDQTTKQDRTETPLVGDATNAYTGFNSFTNVDGFYIKNASSELTMAEYNYFDGKTTAEEIATHMSEKVDYQPFLNKSDAPGTLYGHIRDALTDQPIHTSANPIITAGLAITLPNYDGEYLFLNLPPNAPLEVSVQADGYDTQADEVTLIAGDTTARDYALDSKSEPEGEGEGEGEGGGVGCYGPSMNRTNTGAFASDSILLLGALAALLRLAKRRTPDSPSHATVSACAVPRKAL